MACNRGEYRGLRVRGRVQAFRRPGETKDRLGVTHENSSSIYLLEATGTGKLELDTELAHVQKDMRHGYVNGMDVPVREEFDKILDSIKSDSTEPRERVEALQAKVTELEEDPKTFALARYLKAEMVHLMNTYSIKPKQYTANETKLR